jgi:hypothetical protein
MSNFPKNIFTYFLLFSIPYIPIRNLHHFSYFIDKDNNDILFTSRFLYILRDYSLFWITTPLYIASDIQLIEKKLRNRPININDFYIFAFSNYSYIIKNNHPNNK